MHEFGLIVARCNIVCTTTHTPCTCRFGDASRAITRVCTRVAGECRVGMDRLLLVIWHGWRLTRAMKYCLISYHWYGTDTPQVWNAGGRLGLLDFLVCGSLLEG